MFLHNKQVREQRGSSLFVCRSCAFLKQLNPWICGVGPRSPIIRISPLSSSVHLINSVLHIYWGWQSNVLMLMNYSQNQNAWRQNNNQSHSVVPFQWPTHHFTHSGFVTNGLEREMLLGLQPSGCSVSFSLGGMQTPPGVLMPYYCL